MPRDVVSAPRDVALAPDTESSGPPPRLTLVVGPEALLVDRAISDVTARARAHDPETEVLGLEAAGYTAGTLADITSPSLFGEPRLVVVRGVEACGEAFVTDVTGYVNAVADDEAPPDDVALVLVHAGGVRGKKLLQTVRDAGAVEVPCAPVTRDGDKTDFVQQEFRAARRRISPQAVRALVDAVGTDLRELASACSQLIADTTGTVDPEVVELYHGGRVEVSGFKVADATVAGRTGEALTLLRHALATGADPVPLVAALAAKIRTLAKVAAAGRGSSGDVARRIGVAPWQVDRARRELNGWSSEGVATAITALAEADAAVKGGGRDPVYAVERAVMTVAGARDR